MSRCKKDYYKCKKPYKRDWTCCYEEEYECDCDYGCDYDCKCKCKCKCDYYDCQCIRKELDAALTEAKVFFGEADELRKDLIKKIEEAIIIAEQVQVANAKGDAIIFEAYDVAMQNPCAVECGIDSYLCNNILNRAINEEQKEHYAMDKSQVALDEALFQANESKRFDERGDELFAEYYRCIGVR